MRPNQTNLKWNVRWLAQSDRRWLDKLLEEHWGGGSLMVRGAKKPLSGMPTLVAGYRDGVAIFEPGEPAELLLLHSLHAGVGIGSALLDAVVVELRKAGSKQLLVATTNDNHTALRFYQKRAFMLHELRRGGVDEARRKKPAIPMIGADGIPMRDEIDLMLALQ